MCSYKEDKELALSLHAYRLVKIDCQVSYQAGNVRLYITHEHFVMFEFCHIEVKKFGRITEMTNILF